MRVIGTRHAFNAIVDTTGDLVTLSRLPRVFELDHEAGTLTVDGGVRYGDLGEPLDTAGFALHNLASLPHISVAGACATATHGSGDARGNLATAVSALQLVSATGELVDVSRAQDPELLAGAVVGLGALGVVARLTLDLEPTFRMRQDVFEDVGLDRVVASFDEITASADSVSLFTEWKGPRFEHVWLKRRVRDDGSSEPPPELAGARRATRPIHPIPGMPSAALTEQLGVPGPWHERMPHFRLDRTPSSGDELQTEYLLSRRHAGEALLAIDRIRTRFAHLVQISEVRTVAGDGLWLSTAHGRPSVAIHFTWHPDEPSVRAILPVIEAALEPFEPRPHWGKVSTIPPDVVASTYGRMADFADLRQRLDPNGTFRNPFIASYVPAR